MSRSVKVKPGKGQSLAGFFGGLIFCGIGLFVVIPTFGPFGLLWTLFAVVITIMNGVSAFSEKGIASHEIIIEDDSNYMEQYNNQAETDEENTAEERLQELQNLYQKGLITEEEYQQKRKQVLEEIQYAIVYGSKSNDYSF